MKKTALLVFLPATRSTSPLTIGIYGLRDSTLAPFKKLRSDGGYGCPTNLSDSWILLGTRIVEGVFGNIWVKDSITFTAPADIQVLAIGPSCNSRDNRGDELNGGYYYFLDNLQFYQATAPKPLIAITDGTLCDRPDASITLSMNAAAYYQGSKLQWYKDNIAIAETGGSVIITKDRYSEGWYQCGVQNDTVCIRSDSFHVVWDPLIGLTIGPNKDTTACLGDTVVLKMNGGANAVYLWNNGLEKPAISITESGSYSVTVSNSCNTATASKNVVFQKCPSVFFVPNAFTPNNDRLNDVFKVHYKGQVTEFKLSVYTRFGQRIFMSTDVTKGWDGYVNRIQQSIGTYAWVIDYTDAEGNVHTEKGTFLLLR